MDKSSRTSRAGFGQVETRNLYKSPQTAVSELPNKIFGS